MGISNSFLLLSLKVIETATFILVYSLVFERKILRISRFFISTGKLVITFLISSLVILSLNKGL